MNIVLVTGGFDPIHSGHIAYFEQARSLGDKLIVGLNSDAWLIRKKGRPLMSQEERQTIIQHLRMVDEVVTSTAYDDMDGSSSYLIRQALERYPNDQIIFANGGDRTKTNIPEMSIQDPRLSFEFGVGGEHKQNSSSWILNDYADYIRHQIISEISNKVQHIKVWDTDLGVYIKQQYKIDNNKNS